MSVRRVVAAPDKLRGTLDALQAGRAIADAARRHGATTDLVPLADGGEGTLDALAANGGRLRRVTVHDPLGHPVEAEFLLRGRTAFVEMARASGLALVGGAEGNDPLDASTAGTGELVRAAVADGATRVVVTLGGSATTDGGLGFLEALAPLDRWRGIDLVAATDVRTTFADAADVFAPQKGASPAQVRLLRGRLERLAERYHRERGVDVASLPGSGAAGGLAGAMASIGAEIVSGFDLVAEEVDLGSAWPGPTWSSPPRASSTRGPSRARSSVGSAAWRPRSACRCSRSVVRSSTGWPSRAWCRRWSAGMSPSCRWSPRSAPSGPWATPQGAARGGRGPSPRPGVAGRGGLSGAGATGWHSRVAIANNGSRAV